MINQYNPLRKLRLWVQKPRLDNEYIFILSPPFSGSTMLYKILGTSANVSKFSWEGQFINKVKPIMRGNHWNENQPMPWEKIKKVWHQKWDLSKKYLAEKSPPNLLRAKKIEEHFSPAYFIIMIRNPYAFCEGYTRRKGKGYEEAAKFWVKCAKTQLKNLDNLNQNLFIKYEDLVEKPEETKNKILTFLPGLEDIDINKTFTAKTIEGKKPNQIRNFNKEKIDKLTKYQIEEINKELEPQEDLLTQFNYELIA